MIRPTEWTLQCPLSLEAELSELLDGEDVAGIDGRIVIRHLMGFAFSGAKVEIFSREHPPPHFRVKYQGRTANFDIRTCAPVGPNGLDTRHQKKVREWHKRNRDELIAFWNEKRPSDCPVGRIEVTRAKRKH